MYKVFLVEDEVIVREGLRDNIPWEQYGYRFVGEAGDGEMALPLIRKVRPDVLITDIRMPFMDGLSLCRIVKAEFPEIRIIILSGYDDFEYARSAIDIGVERYLTKPVTRKAVIKAIEELNRKLEAEQEKESDLLPRREEMAAYGQFLRRRFFEDLFAGNYTVEQIYREAGKRSLDVTGPYYRVLLADIFAKDPKNEKKTLHACREDLYRFLLRHPGYLVTEWVSSSFCVIVRGDREAVLRGSDRVKDQLQKLTSAYEDGLDYFLCMSCVTGRLSALKECYEQTGQYYSLRYTNPGVHVVTEDNYPAAAAPADPQESREEADEKNADLLSQALAYIDENYTDEKISLNTVASEINVSPGYFSTFFSQRMDRTFVEYVTEKRIDKAKQLLRDTDEHTAQIAARLGYKDPNYFRYVFKKTTGCTPREFRNRS